jgi:calcineurin-like phosphoesterase family protein
LEIAAANKQPATITRKGKSLIYFTSDTHFNHANVIKFSSRPFENVDHMTETLIENWNICVSRSDVVYHLGDFGWGLKRGGSLFQEIMDRLNGIKHLIIGNHDRDDVVDDKLWQKSSHYDEIKVDLGGIHKQRIVMSHYPMRTWNQSHRGAWMLHGHCHGNLPDVGGLIMDVGVDPRGYRPISLEEVKAFMEGREVISCDHQTGN